LNQMAKQDLQKLLQETNHALSLTDVEKIMCLATLADKVSNPDVIIGKWKSSFPVICGGHVLEPMTIGKGIWIDEYAVKWFGSDENEIMHLVLAFVLDRQTTEETLSNITDKADCMKMILKYWKNADCSYTQILLALDKLMPEKQEPASICFHCNQPIPAKNETVDYGPIIRLLVKEYGGTADHWLHDVDLIEIENLINSWLRMQQEEYAKAKKIADRQHISFPTSAALVEAVKNYREHLNALRESWQTKT